VDYTSIFSIIFITLLIVAAFSYRQHLLKKYNRKLKQSYQDIESIINTAMEAIVISEKGVCVDVNDSALRIMNCKSKDEIIGKKLLYFVSPKDQEIIKQKMRKTIVEPYELELLSLDRKKFPALIRARDLELNEKQVMITSVIDLSEIKSKERLLIEQSKMAALGEMIGHIAHQWRQPLSIITTITSSWEIYNELGDFDKEKVLSESKAILTNAKYLSQTIDDFRVFIKGENTLKEFNIKELLDNLTRLVTPSLQNSQIKFIVNNHLEKNFKGGINEILQALINIINNSMDALNENLTSNEDKLIFIDTFEKNNYVCLNIKDNAGGINEDIKQKIFEPYFTTKHESNGTGLGLYMTYSIIEKMDGKIEVSNVNYGYEGHFYKGANFLICLKL
jgi:two-component system, NarL family, sensor histidine kinase EvgS